MKNLKSLSVEYRCRNWKQLQRIEDLSKDSNFKLSVRETTILSISR